MSDETNKPDPEHEPEAADAPSSEGDNAPQPEGAAEHAEHAPAETERALAEAQNRLLHTLADMENLRRRTEREIADARKYAVSNFAREMLTVADNLRRALDAVPTELREGSDAGAASLIEGVEVTERSLEQTLTKFGVERIEAKGEKFDPQRHQAMLEVDDPDGEPGTVAQEIQVGYAIGDRVLRPAFVAVVKKRKAAKPDDSKSADEGDATQDQPSEG